MERLNIFTGENDGEIPEVDSFLAEISETCERHKLWIDVVYDCLVVTNNPQRLPVILNASVAPYRAGVERGIYELPAKETP